MRGCWPARLLAVTLFYAMFLNVVYLKGIWEISTAKQAAWKHVVASEAGVRVED